MGKSFYILLWDGFGIGLDMISPRLYEFYHKLQRRNSFPYETEDDIKKFLEEHQIAKRFDHWKVIK